MGVDLLAMVEQGGRGGGCGDCCGGGVVLERAGSSWQGGVERRRERGSRAAWTSGEVEKKSGGVLKFAALDLHYEVCTANGASGVF